MATVRFSQELKDAILKNAGSVFTKQIEAARSARPSNDWSGFIYDKLFGVHVPAMNALPITFFKRTTGISIERIGGVQCSLRFELTSERPWPHEFQESDLAKKSGYYGEEIDLKDDLVWGELFAEIKRWKQGIADVEQKRNDFVKQVSQIINAHATLAPALKMWPALWDLVPEPTKEKHREIKVREKKEVEVDVNLGALTAAVTFNKLTR